MDEKLEYMLNNSVKAGLVEDGWKWVGWYFNDLADHKSSKADKNVCPTGKNTGAGRTTDGLRE